MAGPAYKLWTAAVDAPPRLAEPLRVGTGIRVALYVIAQTKLQARDLVESHTGGWVSDLEIHNAMVFGWPEVATRMQLADPGLLAPGTVYAVYGNRVVSVPCLDVEAPAPVELVGRYDHDRRRFVRYTDAERLADAVTIVESMTARLIDRGALRDGEHVAAERVLDAARRVIAAQRATVAGGPPVDTCLADADA